MDNMGFILRVPVCFIGIFCKTLFDVQNAYINGVYNFCINIFILWLVILLKDEQKMFDENVRLCCLNDKI